MIIYDYRLVFNLVITDARITLETLLQLAHEWMQRSGLVIELCVQSINMGTQTTLYKISNRDLKYYTSSNSASCLSDITVQNMLYTKLFTSGISVHILNMLKMY